ncbi:hypothetical protein AAMO2058_000902800 [Amorphochlora amoebiformis]
MGRNVKEHVSTEKTVSAHAGGSRVLACARERQCEESPISVSFRSHILSARHSTEFPANHSVVPIRGLASRPQAGVLLLIETCAAMNLGLSNSFCVLAMKACD